MRGWLQGGFRWSLGGILILLAGSEARAIEATWSYAVQVTASVAESPTPQITLMWPTDTTSNYASPAPASFDVYRKGLAEGGWTLLTPRGLPGMTTSYTDATVAVGTVYEYKIVKAYSGFTGYGYIRAAIKAPLIDHRGKIVLVVALTPEQRGGLAAELGRLEQDLAGDGWTVLRRDVLPTDSVVSVKNLIRADYSGDPANVKAVFLFGHVPVPYSGRLNPDGHADHLGAWPADAYYGDMDGNWTDGSVNQSPGQNTDPDDRARLTNRPGDGKFDQNEIPSDIELEVGRVDLANLPGAFPWDPPGTPTFPSETELLRRYLNKDHAFRHRGLNVSRRAVISDQFGIAGGQAYAASAFRSFAPLVGGNAIRNLINEFNGTLGVWLPAVQSGDYLLSYAAGAGSYWSVNGTGTRGNSNELTHQDVVNSDVRVVFSMMFGSWFGDWDHTNNLLRSFLATPTYGLAAMWSGRPHWFLHPMGLGETLGACARLTQNNAGLYENQVNGGARQIHVALMGDPTLRLHPVAPPGPLSVTLNGPSVGLSWSVSPDTAIIGYHVYRATAVGEPFVRLTPTPQTGTAFTAASLPGATYMVRAVKLEQSPSGSYFNASQGVFWSPPPPPPPPPSPPSSAPRLSNLSIRAQVGTGDRVLIAGFIIHGTEPKQVLIRAAGPALAGAGLIGLLVRPRLQLFQGSNVLVGNTGWSTAANATAIAQATSAVGAGNFPPGSNDSAILITLLPGAYTAIISGVDSGTGISLVEIYETFFDSSRLGNLSGRSWVGTDNDVLIAGLIVSGTEPRKILLRALGPALTTLGVGGVLADPQLQVYQGSRIIAQNDNWGNDSQVVATSARVGAFALPAASKDAALDLTLAPNAYTVIVSGVARTTGVAMIEAYEVK